MDESKEIAIINQPNPLQIARELRGVSDNTRSTYTNAVQNYLKYLTTNNLAMNFDSMQSWLYGIESPKTQNTYLQALKKVLREAYKDDVRLLDLEKDLKKLKQSKADKTIQESDYLTHKEVLKLIKKSPYRFALIIEALFWSGCRISELINIKLKFCEKQKDNIAITVIGKGSKERVVFIPGILFKKIVEEFNGDVYLFEHHKKKFNRTYVSGRIKRYGREILDRKISAHTLRHSKVMFLKDVRKLSPDQIQKAVGHADVSTTLAHYYHGTPTAADQGM